MDRYHRRYPVYGFDTNRGYGTDAHRDAIRTHGPSPIHRYSFKGLRTGYYDSEVWSIEGVREPSVGAEGSEP
jgi:ribonuclease HII